MDYSLIEVVLDHPDFLVINKPAGVSVHKDQQEQGLLSGLAAELGLQHLYLVHRLDQMTSGLLILAKHPSANRQLSLTFQNRDVEKYYLAISDSKPKKKQGLVKGDMAKTRGGSWKLLKTTNNPAITQFFSFSLSDCFSDHAQRVSKGLRLFVLKPRTGKTHQLRVMMKSLGAPIAGDARYALKDESFSMWDRGYLHAWRLQFRYQDQEFDLVAQPSTGRYFCDSGFRQFLMELGHPEALAWPKK
jgi:tRNA pseudouridine32 synthase/23S rRNA pseudouridine746 synthase